MAKILAVDDARVMREMVKVSLSSAGHDVVLVDDGVEALSYAEHNTVDIVVTDIIMPQMDGIKLVSKLRCVAGYEKTPILMLTSEDSEDRKQLAREMGANGWLTKPLDPQRLRNAVNSLLTNSYV